jgi:hypothetical protein
MKRHAVLGVLLLFLSGLPLTMSLLSCGGGGSGGGTSDNGSGTLSMNITDAKPVLPPGTTHVFVTIDEVSVHKDGGSWITLPLAQSPYTIDLLQFSDGKTTHLVPPASLTSGKYTQIRLGVTGGSIVFDTNGDGTDVETVPLEVPSGNLKTDKNFDFEVYGGGAVDLTVDFDLSQSIVVEGNGTYKLKPVLHLVDTQEAATIRGTIPAAAFGSTTEATVTVWWDKDTSCTLDENVDEIYTQVVVESSDPNFEIFWLVPDEAYIVQIDVGGNTFFFTVPGSSGGVCGTLPPSAVYDLGLATVQGTIKATTFVGSTPAVVTVLFDPGGDGVGDPLTDDKAYTQVEVLKPPTGGDAVFSISVFPNQPYVAQIEINGVSPPEYQEAVHASELPAGAVFALNGGNPI